MGEAGASVERASSVATLAARLRLVSERRAPKRVMRKRRGTSLYHDRVVTLTDHDRRLANTVANRNGMRTTNRRKGIYARVTVIANGDIVEWLRLEGDVTELFDVAVIPGVRCPRGIGSGASEMGEVVRGEAMKNAE